MVQFLFRPAVAAMLMGLVWLSSAAVVDSAEADGQKYLLRYKFKPGEVLRWNVEHQAKVDTTVSGSSQTAETTTFSVKSWKVKEVDGKGRITFVNMVDSIDMRQKLSGRQEVRYNSETDKEVPVGFQSAASSVAIPLTTFTIEPSGEVVHRVDHHKTDSQQNEYITTPFPTEAIPIGHRWDVKYHTMCQSKEGVPRRIDLQQDYLLEDVRNGVAIIRVSTVVLTPIGNDPTIEAQLVQSGVDGKLRFDIKGGRVLSQESTVDKDVVNFQGEASRMHYAMQFSERLQSSGSASAGRVPAGPAAPPAAAARPRPRAK